MMATRGRQRARTPIVLQMELAECGAACLGIVLGYLGRWVPLEELREACAVSRDGCSAADIRRAAERYGLEARGWRKRVDQLAEMPKPLILFWGFQHFVVLEGVRGERFLINDPGAGRRSVGKVEFGRLYTGVVIEMSPSPGFQPGPAKPGVLRLLWPWLRGLGGPLAYAAGCGLLLALPGVAIPLLLAGFVDLVLEGGEQDWGAVFVGAVLAAAVLLYALTWLQQRCLRRLTLHVSVERADRFVTRLLQLPISYFSRRQSGDLVARLQSIDETAAMASRDLVALCIELVMSVLFLVLMFAMDGWLAAAVAALAVSCAALMRLLSRYRTDANQVWARENGTLRGVEMANIGRMDLAHLKAQEDDCLARTGGHQAREVVARQRFFALGQVVASFPALFQALGSALVLGVGGWRVMTGDMSLGLLMGFFLVAENFLRPVSRFVEFADRMRTLEANLLRVRDVLTAAPDPGQETPSPGAAVQSIATIDGRLRTVGRIRFEDVTFGYRRAAPLIKGFDLSVEPGQRVAIVGPSASGKSTLAGLLAGLYRPWSGRILLDGHGHAEIPNDVLTRSVALVDQRIRLFAGSVRDNLTMWDPTVPDEAVVAAARDAAIHDEIMARSDGYDAYVAEGGHNFSGGQRQRLEIARALVNDPSVLILDEATASLDPVVELRVDDALRRRGCTCFIVAHRLSTIRDADLIVVLKDGKEVRRGAHEELLAEPDGLYGRLVEAAV